MAEYNDAFNKAGGSSLPGGPMEGFTSKPPQKETLDEIVKSMRKENVEAFTGATGGVGGIPTDEHGHVTIEVTGDLEEKALKELKKKLKEATSPDDLLDLLDQETKRCEVAIGKANALAGKHAYIVGTILITMESQVRNDSTQSWEGYCEAKGINLKIKARIRQLYMSIARIPGVTSYLYWGVDKLGKVGPILSKIKWLDQSDPLGSLMSIYDISADSVYEEVLEKINASVSYARLQANGLDASNETNLKYTEAGHKLEGRDIKALKAIKASNGTNEQLDAYLLSIVKNDGKRPGDESENSPKLPNIHEQAQILLDTVNKFMELPTIETPIEISRIDALIQGLEALKLKVSPKD